MSRVPFAARYLDPGARMGEILFGLIMTLTFTLGAGLIVQEEGREGARQLLIATIGCNIAWGIIDGVFYILGQMFERGRLRRVAVSVKAARSDAEARAHVAGELDEVLERVTTGPERDTLYAAIASNLRGREVESNRLRKADVMGGAASFWLVFFSSLPAAAPFLFIDDPWIALRVSNALLLALLFYVGYRWSKLTLAKPWLAGLVFLFAGTLLVVAAIALGG
ncbi:MAG: hypothetical protein H6R12_1767 [Proteobacteria bacterium]|nr:hypothetical protein [Pseudomonadota bacterium]